MVFISILAVVPAALAGSAGHRIVGYFPQWGIYARDYQVSDISAPKLTHVNYAFIGIDGATKTCKSVDEWADMQRVFPAANGLPAQTWQQSEAKEAGNFGRLRQLKDLYPHLKTLMSIGGWTLSANFPEVARTSESRRIFVSSCLEMMLRQKFDGIDIDWEYPGPDDKADFTLLMKEFRDRLDAREVIDGRHYLLTMAGPAGFTQLPNYDLGEMSRYFDWVNIMAYDFHGGWETRTNHQAPLFLNPGDPEDPVSREKLNTAWAVLAYLQAGVPPEKIGLGVPFYGRAWEGVPSTDNGLFMPGPSLPPPSGPGIWEAGVIDYWKIQDLLAGLLGYNRHWDDYAKVPFVYGPNITPGKTSGGMFITYEDQTSVRGKIQYLREKGLGGIMFWDLSGDIKDSSVPNSLLHIIYQEMNRAYDVSGAQILLLQ